MCIILMIISLITLNYNNKNYDSLTNATIILTKRTKLECLYFYKYNIENETYFDFYKSWSPDCSSIQNISISYSSINPYLNKINGDPYIKIHWVTFLSISILSDAIIIILMIQIIKMYMSEYTYDNLEQV